MTDTAHRHYYSYLIPRRANRLDSLPAGLSFPDPVLAVGFAQDIEFDREAEQGTTTVDLPNSNGTSSSRFHQSAGNGS